MTLAALGSGAQPAASAETHTAVLLLAGDLVLKVKKPVRFAFLDFSTRDRRLAACRREVELNRRLAPDVYLGVIDLLDPQGQPWEHAVLMRRMPAARSMALLVRSPDPPAEQIQAVAATLARFHQGAARSADIDAASTRDAVRRLWADNLAELRELPTDVLDVERVDQIEERALGFLAGRLPLFEARIAAGCCCDGHGDLQAADVFCLDDGPRILDCLEFDDRYRYGDVALDIAFLAMDLERLGGIPASRALVDAYQEAAGIELPRTLLDHYIAYRALVRAKVAALRAAQETDPGRARADRQEASDLLDLCRDHLEASPVRLLLVGGLPGTGKSTVAQALADPLDAVVVRSDVVRKELAGLGPTAPAPAPPGGGLYDDARTEATYRELLERARASIEQGRSAVLDASWISGRHRELARDLARRTSTTLVELRCQLDPDTAAQRIRRRRRHGPDPSDASEEVAAAMARAQDPWPEARSLDTGADATTVARRALTLVQAGT
jgi:uncharacterized protein